MLLPYPSAKYTTSLAKPGTMPEVTGAEVAFAGRSNAGKSTTLNKICRQKSLAKTSKTPGRTQMINYFALSTGEKLIDLPGYGYAKAPLKQKAAWGRLIEFYLQNSPALCGMVIVMDSRRPLREGDILMIEWCEHCEIPMILLLNKIDKLKRNAAVATYQKVKAATENLSMDTKIIQFSATRGTGLEELHAELDKMLVGEDD